MSRSPPPVTNAECKAGLPIAYSGAPLPFDWMSVSAPASDGCHVYLTDANGRKVGAIWGKSGEKISTIEMIVRAVNSHDELVAELRRAIDHFEAWANDHVMEATAETWAIIHCSRAALAKAEAGP